MSTRGKTYESTTYMWNSDDYLARGATGQVFMGYHKRSGQKVAVKMFTNQSEYGAMQREMNAIRRIPKHENIVQFLETDEKERRENIYIIVMELCDAGSLYEVIDSPENAYGLDEEQFKLVMLHVSRGLCHLKGLGFAHRDIKPGNILRVKDLDGKYIFKLTDFGTARQLAPNECFTSLHGTEEYLYPAMYERALINPRARNQFEDKIDLWSVGVTFFHVATGRLPFQPFLKRNDKHTMYRITANKKSGKILGWQTSADGDIFYSDHLPPDTAISNGLKGVITPVLAGLLENDYEKMWAFDRFFKWIELINNFRVIDVFCVSKCVLIKVYLKPDSENLLLEFKKAIQEQTDLSSHHMEFYHENIPLKTPKAGQQFHFPLTTPDSPVTVFGGPPQSSSKLETPAIPRIPQCAANGQHSSLTDDLRYAKECCKVMWSYMHSAEYLARTYKLMHQSANCLSQTVRQEYINLREKLDKVDEFYVHASRQLETHIDGLRYEVSIIQAIGPLNSDAVEIETRKISEEIQTKCQELNRLKEERRTNLNMDALFSQVEGLLEGNCTAILETRVFDDCIVKMRNYLEGITDLFKKFQDEKKKKVGQNDYFGKWVNDVRKQEITKRMEKAMEEVVAMVQERSKVYAKLYELLAKCIALREELRKAEASFSHFINHIQRKNRSLEEWLPKHHQSMQSVYKQMAASGGGGHSMGQSSGSYGQHLSPSHSPSSSIIPQEMITTLTNLLMKTKDSKQLVEHQKDILERKLP